jgi:hypothetical protein
MTLDEKRLGEIATTILQNKLEEEGIQLKPKEIRRDIINLAKKYQIKPSEVAEFFKIGLEKALKKVLAEIGKIKDYSEEEE